MAQNEIFLPMGILAFWTFVILALVPLRRLRAVREGKATPKDFKYGESARVPGEVSLPNRNYVNLFELPVLFYVVCLMFYVTSWVDIYALMLAWVFVALRVIHSLIHIMSNKLRPRMVSFILGYVALLALWCLFFVRMYT
jgi:hypothetical protein